MTPSNRTRFLIAATACALMLPAAYAEEADARGFERSVKRTGPDGHTRTWTKRTDVNRGQGRLERRTVRTGPQGRSAETRAVTERTEDGYTRSVERTGPEGRTRTRDAVGTRTDDGFTRSVVREGPKGTSTSDYRVERDREAGTVSRSADHVLPDGRSASTRSEAARTDDGYVRSTTRTGPDGGVLQTDVDVSVDSETGTRTRTVTRSGGAEE